MRANQLRLWFASLAYVLLEAVRRIGLADTKPTRATCGTIRLKQDDMVPLVNIGPVPDPNTVLGIISSVIVILC